jgi:hypothetical protein
MMPRNLRHLVIILSVGVLLGLISLHSLHNRIQKLAEDQLSEEQARREVLQPQLSTPTDVKVRAKIFWAVSADRCAPMELEMSLSADPVQRAKQVMQALIELPPTPEQRTLPGNASLLGFYLLPDGTAVADFSEALTAESPSGILSENLEIESIVKTLESNVPALHRLKILIHGQEVDTLAGHVDLTGFFELNAPVQPAAAADAQSSGANMAQSAAAAQPPAR